MDKLLNRLFWFILLVLFVLLATGEEQLRIIIAVLAAIVICILAFLFRWLTLDGAKAAIVLGAFTYGLGGLNASFILILFFVTGSWLAKLNNYKVRRIDYNNVYDSRRDGLQVWANGFWFSFFLVLHFIFHSEIWFVAAIASLATATSDTWATEVGVLTNTGKTILITNFQPVVAGADGGISITGTVAAMMGSTLIASVYMAFSPNHNISEFILLSISGFLGCVFDSYLGAIFQYNHKAIRIPWKKDNRITLGNNFVNWSAIGFGAILMILLRIFFK